jgi:hypothetical protein
VFPSFHHAALRPGRTDIETVHLPHGDGGFTDNLGLMPLLVRHVKNILVFVNAKNDFDENLDIESFFRPVLHRTGSGDRTMNVVFDESEYRNLLAGFRENVAAGKASVSCGRNWEVHANELYNVSGYKGLNICWIYNRPATAWELELPSKVRELMHPPADRRKEYEKFGSFEDFPWYATFFENKPNLIRLTTPQVNLLSNFTAWSITNPVSRDVITRTITLLASP